jgi:L,D-transpeptidase YcbB
MQVVDGSGRLVNHHQLNWSSFHAGYFPYILRQSTGCDNALGILKFNINTPYGVYLHDTNNKTAFLSGSRFYSHGCIRLEDPLALGNRLLSGKLDTAFLQSCFKEQKPVPVQVKKPVPVFVVYMPVSADEKGKLYYYKDVYKLMK